MQEDVREPYLINKLEKGSSLIFVYWIQNDHMPSIERAFGEIIKKKKKKILLKTEARVS